MYEQSCPDIVIGDGCQGMSFYQVLLVYCYHCGAKAILLERSVLVRA